jgi:catalase
LKDAIDREGAVLNVVAPMVGGVEASDGSSIEAVEKIHGGPSFVFDAVAILLSAEGAALLGDEASARDFVADAIVHCKFIAHKAAAMPLLQKAGVAKAIDRGVVPLKEPTDAESFIETCRQLRLWEREAQVKRI